MTWCVSLTRSAQVGRHEATSDVEAAVALEAFEQIEQHRQQVDAGAADLDAELEAEPSVASRTTDSVAAALRSGFAVGSTRAYQAGSSSTTRNG